MNELQTIENKIAEKRAALENVQGMECSVFTRIVGYYRATHNFNAGQAAQREKRINFDLNKSNKNDENQS